MNRILAIIIFFTVSYFQGVAQGIEFFQGTWKDAMAKAKAEDKLLFVDAFAKWCGPCKAMAKNVFTQEKVGAYFNRNFINLKLDMEESDGITFGHKYPVSAYPTLFFLDGDGKVIKSVRGGQQADGLIAHGAEAIQKNDKSGQFEEKYLAGERGYDFMLNYVKALNMAGKPSLKISNDYLSSGPSITESQKIMFLLEAAVDADSRIFDMLLVEKSKAIELAGQPVFEERAIKACQNAVNKAVTYEMESLLAEVMEKAKTAFPKDAASYNAKFQMQYYKSVRNEVKYTEAYKAYWKKIDKDADKIKFIINDITRSFGDNPKMMKDAADYAEKLFDLKEDMESLNIFCNILIDLKQPEKAIKIVQEAKIKAEKRGKDAAQFDALLKYLNAIKA
jgi:thiol-disulfide isomerase/thioredoxin